MPIGLYKRHTPPLALSAYSNKGDITPREGGEWLDKTEPSGEKLEPLSFVLDFDNPWFRQVDLNGARYIMWTNHFIGSTIAYIMPPSSYITWPIERKFIELTENDIGPTCNEPDEETIEFIKTQNLLESISWLQTTTPRFFPSTDFEIELLPAEDKEEPMLALRIYGAIPVKEFRNKRHAICDAMLEAGHKKLYSIISIFQRRIQNLGRETLSWYSAVSEE